MRRGKHNDWKSNGYAKPGRKRTTDHAKIRKLFAKGLTLKQVAEACGCSATQVWNVKQNLYKD